MRFRDQGLGLGFKVYGNIFMDYMALRTPTQNLF